MVSALALAYGTIVYTALAMATGGLASRGSPGARRLRGDGGIRHDAVEHRGFSRCVRRRADVSALVYALERTTPTRVAISVAVNPIASAIFGAYALNEPITVNLVVRLVIVAVGIAVASSNR